MTPAQFVEALALALQRLLPHRVAQVREGRRVYMWPNGIGITASGVRR